MASHVGYADPVLNASRPAFTEARGQMHGETMNRDEYNILFHKLELNLVAFKRLMDCDEEVLKLVNAAIEAEREACAKVLDEMAAKDKISNYYKVAALAIRERGAP